MSTRVEVLLWAQRIVGRKGAPAHELLEIREDATLEQAQDAFHKVAKIAHPDLHRTTLDAAELENVTTAYAYVAAAYQAIRSAKARGSTGKIPGVAPEKPTTTERTSETARIKRQSEPVTNVVRLPGGGIVAGRGGATRPPLKPTVPPADKPRVTTPPADKARAAAPAAPAAAAVTEASAPSAPVSPSAAMNSKALVYYRKAEMALRQGDLRMALLNLKMSIASDPASTFLRHALAEVEAELKAK